VDRTLAIGDVTATAFLPGDPAAVVATPDAGERPEFEVGAQVARADSGITAEMTVVWTLRRHG
jgi:hypothetical protein